MPTGLLTISQYAPEPPIQVPADSTFEVRGWYSRSFVAGDGVTPIEGNPYQGQQGFYYSIDAELNGSGDLVVLAHEIQATTLSNPTANYFEGLWIDSTFFCYLLPNTQGVSGWQIPTVYGDPIAFDEIATYNQAKRLLYPPDTYFTADEVIQEIRRLAGNFDYAALNVNGIASIYPAPVVASAPENYGTNAKNLPTKTAPVYYASQYTSFTAAVTAIGSTVATLVVTEAQMAVGATTSIPATLILAFEGAGSLSGTSQTLTILSGSSSWPIRKLFFSSLTISFTGNTSASVYRIDWWGTPTGTNDTAICQAAATAFPVNAYIKLVTDRTYASEVLTPKQGQTWDLNGAAMVRLNSSPLSLYLFKIANGTDNGSNFVLPNTALSSGVQGATSVTVASSALFTAGDRIIVSAGTFTDSGTEEGPLEFNTVKTVTDGTHLALANPLAYNYSAFGLPGQTGANVKKLGQGTSVVNHVRVTGGTLRPGAGANGPYFLITNTEDVEIDHVTAEGSGAGWNTGANVNRLKFHDNVLTGTPLTANTAMNFASLVYSHIVGNFFTSEVLGNGASDVNNNLNLEVTCHDNNLSNNWFGPIRGTSVAAIDFNKGSFNNTIIGNRIWGSDVDVAAGIVTLGIKTFQFGTPANTGNIILGNWINNILIGIGDNASNSVIDGNSLFNTTTNADSVALQVDNLSAHIGVNPATGFTYQTSQTIGGTSAIIRARLGYTQLFEGSGSPEGVVTAAIGSVYRRLNGGPFTSIYFKVSGAAGNTGWVAVAVQSEGAALTVSSNTIIPTDYVHRVGAGLIKTITVPSGFISGTIALLPTAAFTYDATGNLLGTGTATVSRVMFATYSAALSKWLMSY